MNKEEYKAFEKAVESFVESNNIYKNFSVESEATYSTATCDCCGTKLAGNRCKISAFNKIKREIVYFDNVCPDCVYYLEYGKLDDMTMYEMES